MKKLASLLACLATSVAALLPVVASAGTIVYYHNDLLGSPVVASNASGQVIWKESYRPYGERITNATASSTNDIWFTSRRQDADTGLVYMGARYYDPAVGRFVSTDPIGFNAGNILSFNRYAYANDNPFRYKDPNGKASVGTQIDELAVGCGPASCAGFATLRAVYEMSTFGFASVHDPMRDAYDRGAATGEEYVRIGIAGGAAVALTGYAGGGIVGEAAGSLLSISGRAVANEGIYEFTAASGKRYVGQSGDIATRIEQHLASGKLLPGDVASVQTTEVLGGKIAREVAEQVRINGLGGIQNLENLRNPIGPARQYLMP
jgi:RHS repeat-associated protein